MAEQVRDFIDGTSLADQFRRQAMAHQMGAGPAGKLDSPDLQSRSHDPRDRGTGPEWPNGRHSAEENPPAIDPGPGMENVIGKRFARLLHERHNPIAPRLALSHEDLGSAPPNILEFERSQFLVANAGGGQQEQNRAVAPALRRRPVDGIDSPPDVLPREPWRQMGQPPTRRSWNKPGKVLIIEIRPAQKSKECSSIRGGR